MATHLLVANPTAQSGRNAERVERALAHLRGYGVTVDLLPTLPEGRTIAAVTRALDDGEARVVIAMGGDGTFREVASGLYLSRRREEVALGMLPTGTANDQGRSFGLDPSDSGLADNVEVIARAAETRLDVGTYRSGPQFGALGEITYFFDSAGFGLSARVLAERNRDRKAVESMAVLKDIFRDHAVYAGAFLKTFLSSYVVDDKFVVNARIDGAPAELAGLVDLVIKATRIYGGSWVFDPTSRHDDGLFELVPFCGKRDWASKAIATLDGNPLGEAELRAVGIAHSPQHRGSSFDLEFHAPPEGAPLAAQIDGEEWPVAPCVRIAVIPRGLRLIVPVAHATPSPATR